MKPDWERDGVQLYLGDCMEVLPKLSVIDLTVTSPPYNQSLEQIRPSGFKSEGSSQWASRISSAYHDSVDEEVYQNNQIDALNLINDISRDSGSIFWNHKCRWREKKLIHPLEMFRESKWLLRQEIIWARDGSLTQNAKMFPPSEERIYWGFKKTWKWNPESNKHMSVWKIVSEKMSEHPVAFPIAIPLRAIEAASDNGDVVLDPFMGSGTTGVAAVRLGRKFIGVEQDARHFETAVNRISQALDNERCSLFPVSKDRQLSLLNTEGGEA